MHSEYLLIVYLIVILRNFASSRQVVWSWFSHLSPKRMLPVTGNGVPSPICSASFDPTKIKRRPWLRIYYIQVHITYYKHIINPGNQLCCQSVSV